MTNRFLNAKLNILNGEFYKLNDCEGSLRQRHYRLNEQEEYLISFDTIEMEKKRGLRDMLEIMKIFDDKS